MKFKFLSLILISSLFSCDTKTQKSMSELPNAPIAKQIPKNATTVIIRMGRMPYMDQSGLYVMEDVLIDLVNEGKMVLLVNILNQPKYMMEQIDIMPNLMPKERMFIDFNASMVWIKAN